MHAKKAASLECMMPNTLSGVPILLRGDVWMCWCHEFQISDLIISSLHFLLHSEENIWTSVFSKYWEDLPNATVVVRIQKLINVILKSLNITNIPLIHQLSFFMISMKINYWKLYDFHRFAILVFSHPCQLPRGTLLSKCFKVAIKPV